MKEALNYLDKIFKLDDVIVVAVSGGADSMFLLHLLKKLESKFQLKIVVAHVNHKLRGESEEEALFVRKYCEDNHLIYEYMEILDYQKNNIENEARERRYSFFESLVNKYNAEYLATAHHGDDLMETILMRLTRGSSIKGYSGFKRCVNLGSYKIIRPLITMTKEEILNYMQDNHLNFVVDKSNFSRDYTRNRYRMDVLPFFKKENKNVHKKFLKFSEELENVNQFVDNYVKKLLVNIEDENGLMIDKLLELDDFSLKKIMEYELSLVYVDDLYLISDKHTEALTHLVKSDKSNLSINLPRGIAASKSYNYFKLVKHNKEFNFNYILEDEVKGNWGVIKKINSCSKKSNYVIRLDSKDIKLPIIVRSRELGDKMAVKNLNGTKKVKDIFIDEKVPLDKRRDFPVVVDSENRVLWLPGVKKSKFDVETDGIYDIILSYEEEYNDK